MHTIIQLCTEAWGGPHVQRHLHKLRHGEAKTLGTAVCKVLLPHPLLMHISLRHPTLLHTLLDMCLTSSAQIPSLLLRMMQFALSALSSTPKTCNTIFGKLSVLHPCTSSAALINSHVRKQVNMILVSNCTAVFLNDLYFLTISRAWLRLFHLQSRRRPLRHILHEAYFKDALTVAWQLLLRCGPALSVVRLCGIISSQSMFF